MYKIIGFSALLLVFISSVGMTQTFAEEIPDEKLAFAGYLEETLGHFWAIEKNLDDKNAELALVHATHPIAELYDSMKPELKEKDPAFDVKVQKSLMELGKKTGSDITRQDAQNAINEAKKIIEDARILMVGKTLSDDTSFKAKLMIGLLKISIGEYEEGVTNGQINMMAEFQDGSAFVWRSQQIYETIKSDVPEHEAEEIVEFYEDLWKAYDERADPATVETLANGIIHELEVVSGEESEEKELTDYVTNVRNLLTEAKEEYAKGTTDEALSLATKAYLDNFEYLESTVGARNPELNHDIEQMMRVELRDMIKNGAPVSEVSAQIDDILLKMDEVAVIVPEFGQIAAMILIAGLIGSIVIFSKSKNLIRIPRI